MPLYEYECTACGERTEVIQAFSDPPLTICPVCGGTLRKLLSSPAFQFKGTGWYVTDYGKSGGKESRGKTSEESTGDSSKETERASSEASGASRDGGAGEGRKTEDSSNGKKDGARGAASPSPGAAPAPAPSKKKKGESK